MGTVLSESSMMPRQSPAVYRRRRLVVLVGLIVVLSLLVWAAFGVASLFRGEGTTATSGASPTQSASARATAMPSPSATASKTATPKPTPKTTEYPLCYDDLIQVQMSTDKQTYGPKENPVLSMKITNLSSEDCVISLGTNVQEFRVLSGSKQVFSTADCQVDPKELLKHVKAGQSETARFTWERTATSANCGPVPVQILPGTYQVVGVLGKVTSAPTSFELLAQ